VPLLGPCANPRCISYDAAWSSALRGLALKRCSVRCPKCGFAYVWRRRDPATVTILERCESWEKFVCNLCKSGGALTRLCRCVFLSSNAFLAEAGRQGFYSEVLNNPGLRAKHRQILLHLRASHPQLKRSDVNTYSPGSYLFLLKRDREWFDLNMPPMPICRRIYEPSESDEEMSANVAAAAMRIKERFGPPVRVTRSSILVELDCKPLFYAHRDALPKTTRAISDNIEDVPAFTLRRLDWIARDHAERGKRLTRRALKDAVWRKLLYHPSVHQHIEHLVQHASESN
jgi:Tn7-like transposition protein D